MVCTPCQQRAEARRQAMLSRMEQENPASVKQMRALESYKATRNSYSDPIPPSLEMEAGAQPITNTSPTARNA